MVIKEHVHLSAYTTFRVGGPARYFGEVDTIDDLQEGIAFGKKHTLPVYILGGGSTIVFPDDGWRGLVLRMNIRGVSFKHHDDSVYVTAAAGEHWDAFVAQTVEKKLWGLENLSGIPGTVGAAPIQNIGAYGVEVGTFVEWVEVFDQKESRIRRLARDTCAFSYRDSIFKSADGKRYVITAVCFKLFRDGKPRIDYKDIARELDRRGATTVSQKEIRNIVLAIRSGKFPDLSTTGTAGSFFKNPIVSNEEYRLLQDRFPETPCYSVDADTVKIPIAYILERLGFKGFCEGRVCTHKDHALVVVTRDGATAQDIVSFTEHVAQKVKEETNITIEPEVTVIKNKK